MKKENLVQVLKSFFSDEKIDFVFEEPPFKERSVYAITLFSPRISKSDCAFLRGSFSTEDLNLQVGFDVELTDRLKPSAIQRSYPAMTEEDKKLPPAIIWTALEASFKSLFELGQPQTISELKLKFSQGPCAGDLAYFFNLDSSQYPQIKSSKGIALNMQFVCHPLTLAFLIVRKAQQ